MDMGLQGGVALVTGAARGIGAGIARMLAAEGAKVAIVDIAHLDLADALAREIRGHGGEALVLEADIGDRGAVTGLVETVASRLGPINVLVNNAAALSRKTIIEDAFSDWDRVVRTNLYGCYFCSSEVARHMIGGGKGGRIVNISSIHGRVVKAGTGAYGATKAAIEMLTKQLAVELAPHGIRVNAVAPGTISTDLNIPLYKSNRPDDVILRNAVLKRVPVGRIGNVQDIARAVTFLASPLTEYVTGAILYVDGGYVAEGTPRS
jgi:NAD(P)-dependent dehydrogenase (short-subunit alcohol dehydrogenase family)